MHLKDEVRAITVHTITQAVLFSIPCETYVELMKEEVLMNKLNKMEILRSVPAFQSLQGNILEQFLTACHIYRYEPNVSLLKVGERENIYFILEGQCRASRLVPFLVKKDSETTEIPDAYIPGTVPPLGTSIAYYNMSIGLIGPGSFFPKISLLRSEALQYRLQKFNLEKILILVNSILRHTGEEQSRADKTNIASIFSRDLNEVSYCLFLTV